jgi:hypothetical protein
VHGGHKNDYFGGFQDHWVSRRDSLLQETGHCSPLRLQVLSCLPGIGTVGLHGLLCMKA